jgi:small subunit ribosomal protein S3
VGQKINPTVFRTGITKAHKSTWFAQYNGYRELLKEDYELRTFLEKYFKKACKEAGIAELEIHRKGNWLVDIIIHTPKPKLIAGAVDSHTERGRGLSLIDSLKKITNDSKRIRLKVFPIEQWLHESCLVAQSIGDQLERRVEFRKVMRETTRMLKKRGVKGFKIQIAGRLNGAQIARAEWAREGRVPLQTIGADISYAGHRASTKYGTLGIKVWIFKNH